MVVYRLNWWRIKKSNLGTATYGYVWITLVRKRIWNLVRHSKSICTRRWCSTIGLGNVLAEMSNAVLDIILGNVDIRITHGIAQFDINNLLDKKCWHNHPINQFELCWIKGASLTALCLSSAPAVVSPNPLLPIMMLTSLAHAAFGRDFWVDPENAKGLITLGRMAGASRDSGRFFEYFLRLFSFFA